jgi:hypothetical protein
VQGGRGTVNSLPNPFWALLFACLGVSLIAMALYHSAEPGVTTAVISAGTALIAGAFGYINGHAAGAAAQNPTQAGMVPPENK